MFARARRSLALLLLVAIFVLGAGFPAPSGAAEAQDPPTPEAIPGQMILNFEQSTTPEDRDRIVAALGGQTLWELGMLPVRLVALPEDRAVGAATIPPGLRSAMPNYVTRQQATPNDQFQQFVWGMHNTGQTITDANGVTQTGITDADVDAPEAWDITTGSKNVVVAILDSGIDLQHLDLIDNLWTAPAGWNIPQYPNCGAGSHGIDTTQFTSNHVYNCEPWDDNGHGTHVAGTIGAKGNNGLVVSGINWSVSMMILRHANAQGTSNTYDTLVALDYAHYARAKGINLRVINGSFGGPSANQTFIDALNILNQQDILFVAAAGNGGADSVGDNNDVTPFYPSSYDVPNMIAVAATDNRDQLAGFSNYGARSVHMAAPGNGILSTFPTYPVTLNDLPYAFGVLNGTSMASPLVAGAAALVLSAPGLGNLTVAQLKHRLVDCGDPIPALAGKTVSGKRLNVRKAIDGCPVTFTDVPQGHPYYQAITTLATDGVIRGYGDGRYGPEDTTLRAQMAVLIVRAMGWSGEHADNPFTDGGGLAPALWDAVAILAAKPFNCGRSSPCFVATGYGGTTFGPNDKVLHAQTISFITRAMIAKGEWQRQPDNDPGLYPSIAANSGHRLDVITYYHYAGAIPGTSPRATWPEAFQPSNRGWFAQALYQAIR